MAGRNRMNYGRDPGSVQHQGYPYGDRALGHLGSSRDSGTGGRDASSMRRGSDLDPLLSRRLPGPSFPLVDPRAYSDRNVHGIQGDGRLVPGVRGPLPPEPPIHSSRQVWSAGLQRFPYEQGGPMGPGEMGSYSHPLPPMRGVGDVGSLNYRNVENYGLMHKQQVPMSDGRLRYPSHELGVSQLPEAGLKVSGGYRGGYVGPEQASLALGVAQSRKLQRQGIYPERQFARDDRLMRMSDWDDDGRIAPLSPRAMPMSPRRDDMVGMMSPRRDEWASPPMSPRREDFQYMMSPRREDISPLRTQWRREYPPVVDYRGRLPQRRVISPSREEEFLIQPRVDFPMSPRRFSPPMSPRGGWDYDAAPPVSPPRLNFPMSPRRDSPPRSPAWGRSRHGAKPASQWDVLPGNSAREYWRNSESERQFRSDNRHEYQRERERDVGYGAEIDDPKRWSSSRRGEGRFGSGNDDEFLNQGSGRNYDDHQPRRYGMANSRPYAYNSMVNQRVGLVTKYIERERAERAAKEFAEKPFKDSTRKRPADDERPPADSSRPFRSDRHTEKDSLEAAIAKTTANMSKYVSSSVKRPSINENSNTGPAAANGKVEPAPNKDKTLPAENPSAANVAEIPAATNGTAAAGSDGRPSPQEAAEDKNQEAKNSKNPVPGKPGNADAPLKNNVDATNGNINGLQSTGPSNVSANGNTNSDSKPDGDLHREPASKRPSLVSEIERATKNRKLSEQQMHTPEVDETYYNADELSADFITKMTKAGSRYSRVINDDHSLRRRYEGGGGQGGLHCLVCGKGSKAYSDIYELISHAQDSQVQNKRVDHMGFRKALIDVLKLDIKEPRHSIIEADEDTIVWPPIVVVENTRTGMGADRRWEGVSGSEMAVLLNELGHVHGRAKPIWDKIGHRGIVHVEFDPTLEGLQEAERLHNYFLQSGRGRVQWDIIRPFETGLPECDIVPEGPDFTQFDEVTQTTRRVIYGYLALKKDVDNIFGKKQRKKVQVTNRKEVKVKLLAEPAGELLVIGLS